MSAWDCPSGFAPRHAGMCPKYPFPLMLRLHFGQGLTTSACFCEAPTGNVRCVAVSRPYSSMSHFAMAGSIRPKFNSELCLRQNASNDRSVTDVSVSLSSPSAIHFPTSSDQESAEHEPHLQCRAASPDSSLQEPPTAGLKVQDESFPRGVLPS